MSRLWLIDEVTDHGPGQWYRYGVRGRNAETGERFSWAVPSLDDERYDVTGARWENRIKDEIAPNA